MHPALRGETDRVASAVVNLAEIGKRRSAPANGAPYRQHDDSFRFDEKVDVVSGCTKQDPADARDPT